MKDFAQKRPPSPAAEQSSVCTANGGSYSKREQKTNYFSVNVLKSNIKSTYTTGTHTHTYPVCRIECLHPHRLMAIVRAHYYLECRVSLSHSHVVCVCVSPVFYLDTSSPTHRSIITDAFEIEMIFFPRCRFKALCFLRTNSTNCQSLSTALFACTRPQTHAHTARDKHARKSDFRAISISNAHTLSQSTSIIYGSNPLFPIFYNIIVFFCDSLSLSRTLRTFSQSLTLPKPVSIQIEFIGLFDTHKTDKRVRLYTYSELDILFLFIHLIRNSVMD